RLGPGRDGLIRQPTFQVLGQGAGGGIAALGLPRHRFQADRLQGAGEIGRDLARRGGPTPAGFLPPDPPLPPPALAPGRPAGGGGSPWLAFSGTTRTSRSSIGPRPVRRQ